MAVQSAAEEYALALRQGQKEYSELIAAGKSPYPAVLDEILADKGPVQTQDLGVMEIPAQRIIGVKSAGRITAFTPSFCPLLDAKTEFGTKWISLCGVHLGEMGIQDPIICYEYLGNFYVQEGNKRVSVLRHFGAPRIPAEVIRVLPARDEDPRIQAYYEFLDFYKVSRSYAIQYRRPLDYAKLLRFLKRNWEDKWTEEERRTFQNYFYYFSEAFAALNTKQADILPEEALLIWLQVHPFRELGTLCAADLKKSLSAIWEDVLSSHDVIRVQTEVQPGKAGILGRLIVPDSLVVAFLYQMTPSTSPWALSHDKGVEHIANVFGDDKLCVRRYFNANSPEQAEALIEQAVAEGADVVFTTAPLLRAATLKAAIRYPKVQFLNCSVDQPYSSVRSYYGRIYEAKFITGAIAGALSLDNRIGYIASYPIFGEPASINAFALGAQLTNPMAQIELRWSCVEGKPLADFLAGGIRVISNRDAPSRAKMYLDFCTYGTYLMDDLGELIPLVSPVWEWGKYYELVLDSMFSGKWKNEKNGSAALNYWLGMDSGVIDISLSEKLPEGVRALARILQQGLREKKIDPFRRRIVAQDGSVKNDGSHIFTPDDLLHMDWLCDNVLGAIPKYEEILPISQPMVRELGLFREQFLSGKEAHPGENTDHIR